MIGMEGKFVRLEREFDGGLQNPRAADTVAQGVECYQLQ
jgi:hypothetical protein